uniref:Odorant receptor n=1 Tax=Campoletis chlorideae TaxID=219166 RepID=A0A346D462_9HYME|nr:odorant receptor [Campoletis chlorideae]
MVHKVSLEGAVNFTRLSVRLVCTWPPSGSATKWQIAREDYAWCISFLSVLCLLIPLINSIPEYITNPIVITQTMCFCSACVIIMMKTLVLRLHRKKCQILVDEMEEFMNNCCEEERRVLESYVDKCWVYHTIISFMNYLASISMIISPFVISDQKMPTAAVYPFSIESGIPMYLAFVHQSIVGLQTSAGLTVDCQMAMMMWYAGARLELFAIEIQNDSSDMKQFSYYIEKHQRLLVYATRVSETMRYVAFTTTCVCGIASIVCCMQLASNQPILVKLQFGPVSVVCLTNLMICAWPTENIVRVERQLFTTFHGSKCHPSFRGTSL